MRPTSVLEALRQICRDLDAGREPRAIEWRRAAGTVEVRYPLVFESQGTTDGGAR